MGEESAVCLPMRQDFLSLLIFRRVFHGDFERAVIIERLQEHALALEQRWHRKLFCLLSEVCSPIITVEKRHLTWSKDYNFQKSEFITVKL